MKYKKIAIIGGSGLEKLDLFDSSEMLNPQTPYGECSSPVIFGKIGDKEVYIFSRHGFNHHITPTHVNNRAHIKAIKDLGCDAIIATTACGSLREEIKPGHLVFPNQVIDFTKFRPNTFFDDFSDGGFHHTPFADPFNADLNMQLAEMAEELKLNHHSDKTIITIEGPRFSSRAESHMFKAWGADLINMSSAPEVILANELEIPYAAVAMSTDYDCWKDDEAPVDAQSVLDVFHRNAKNVIDLLQLFLSR
jgi:5'-methylthioadenosine phosphorylase